MSEEQEPVDVPLAKIPVVIDAATLPDGTLGIARKAAATRKNRMNMLWEGTQALLAVTLTIATIYVCIRTPLKVGADGQTIEVPVPETLKNALFVVLGFYFGRTNHTRPTPTDPAGTGESL